MKTKGCCAVERAPVVPGSANATPAPQSGSGQVKRSQAANVGDLVVGLTVSSDPTHHDRLWYPPPHDRSTPLFLRNASILR